MLEGAKSEGFKGRGLEIIKLFGFNSYGETWILTNRCGTLFLYSFNGFGSFVLYTCELWYENEMDICKIGTYKYR